MNCYNLVLPCIPITVLVKHFDEFNPVCFVSIKLKKTYSKTTFKKSPANCPTPKKSHRPVVHRPIVRAPISTGMGDRFSAVILSLMALWLELVD